MSISAGASDGATPEASLASMPPSSIEGLKASTPPTGRGWTSMAFDPTTQNILLFGGAYTTGSYHEFSQPLNDTWAWDGTRWTRLDPGPAPAARYSGAVAWDSQHNLVVLHGGLNGSQFLNETYAWGGSRWILMSPATSPPSPLGQQPMTYDRHIREAVLFSYSGPAAVMPPGDTWGWNGSDWTRLSATPPDGYSAASFPAALAYDPISKRTILFGHTASGPATWSFDGVNWTKMSESGSSSGGFVMATDEYHSRVMLFGDNGDTWSWDGSRWTAANPRHAPSQRQRASVAYDAKHHVVILFGGLRRDANSAQDLNDTWAWNGEDWTLLSS